MDAKSNSTEPLLTTIPALPMTVSFSPIVWLGIYVRQKPNTAAAAAVNSARNMTADNYVTDMNQPIVVIWRNLRMFATDVLWRNPAGKPMLTTQHIKQTLLTKRSFPNLAPGFVLLPRSSWKLTQLFLRWLEKVSL